MSWAARGITALLLLSVSVHGLQRDPYKVLGVRRTSSEQEIKHAFRRLSRQWHPDKNKSPGATEKFQEISAAYDFLSDPSRAGQAWDFAGPSTASNSRQFPSYPDAAFYYAHNAYHTVLDLDPLRMVELLSKWIEDQFTRNREVLQPLWTAPVDRAVCKGLATAWRLPQLLEPALLFGAKYEVFAYVIGQWRTWRASGVLLELSFWVARQTPCLRHQQSSSNNNSEAEWSTGDSISTRNSQDADYDGGEQESRDYISPDKELLIELQQRLQQQRLIRQQLLAGEEAKKQSVTSNSSRSSSRNAAGSRQSSTADADSVVLQDSMGLHVSADQMKVQQLPGRALWWMLLTLAACSFRHSKKTITGAWVVTVLGLIYIGRLSWSGEGAAGDRMRDLADALEAGNVLGLLIGSCFVVGCFTAIVLLPAALVSALITASVWTWAAVSCTSIAVTPCLSRMGAGLWISLKLWGLSEHGDPARSGLLLIGLGYLFYKKPGLVWSLWLGLLASPVLFVWHFLRVQAVQTLQWLGLLSSSLPSTAGGRVGSMALATQQQQQLRQQQTQGVDLGPLSAAGGLGTGTKSADVTLPNPESLQATATATITTDIPAKLKKRKRVAGVDSEAVAAAAAVPLPSPEQQQDPPEFVAYTGSRKGRSRVRRAAGFVFGGPWCPSGFGARELAITCHWWINMLGWELPTRVLVAGAFSIHLTLFVTFAALAIASFGLPINWLTVQLLVTVVTCRVGPITGLIWVLLKGLDDVARWMDPAANAKKQKLARRPRGRARL